MKTATVRDLRNRYTSPLDWIEADVKAGGLRLAICNHASIIDEAKRLSSTRTLAEGHRSFDNLHVASALVLQADLFLTFDAKRKRLAEAEGILVPGERLTSPRAPRSAAPRAGGCS